MEPSVCRLSAVTPFGQSEVRCPAGRRDHHRQSLPGARMRGAFAAGWRAQRHSERG